MIYIYTLIWAIIIGAIAGITAHRLVPKHVHRYVFIAAALISLFVRFCITVYVFKDSTETFGTDGLTYHKVARDVALQLGNGVSIFDVDYRFTWYTVFMGALYNLFGIDRYLAAFINAYMAFVAGIILFKIALRQKYSFFNSAFISLVFLYFPNMMMWTADTRKEALTMLVSIVIWYLIQGVMLISPSKEDIIRCLVKILAVCLLIWLSTLMRIYLFIPIAIGIISSQLFNLRQNKKAINMILIAAVLLTSILVFFTTVYPQLQNHHAVMFGDEGPEDFAQNLTIKAARLRDIAANKNLFFSLVSYMIEPLPGNVAIQDIKGMNTVIFAVQADMIIWYICILAALIGICKAIKHKAGFFVGILMFCVVYVAINILIVEYDPGTIYRYRCQIIPFILLFIDWHMIRNLMARLCERIYHFRSHGRSTKGLNA